MDDSSRGQTYSTYANGHRQTLSNEDFLSEVFGNAPKDAVAWVTGFREDPIKADGKHWGGRPVPNGVLPGLIQDSTNNFFAISTFRKGQDKRYHRRKETFIACHVIIVDDVGTKVPEYTIALEPSYKLETSPGNYQYGYLLKEPITDRGLVERVQDAMVAQGLAVDGKDPGMKGVTRYGRLPVGWNTKEKYIERLGAPFVHQLEEWHPEQRYTLQEIIEAFELDLSQTRAQGAQAGGDDLILKALRDKGWVQGPKDGKEGAWYIRCPWVDEHGDKADTGAAYFEPGYNGYTGPGFKCWHGHCEDRTIKDVLALFKKEGVDVGAKKKAKPGETQPPKLAHLLQLLREQWAGRLRLNIFSQKREIDGKDLGDEDVTRIREDIENLTGRSFGKDIAIDAIELVCAENSYDSLVEYLEGLKWDGEPRIDTWLTDVYGVEKNEYTMAAGRCFLISGVARGLNPGAKVRLVLLIYGPEELGKSLSLAELCPRRDWFTDTLPADLHSKDAAITLFGKWIVESSEMASMRRSESEAVKAFLSRDVDDYRPPYARYNVQVPRRCIIAATTNHDDVLPAKEENTRYLPIRATEYNQEYLLDVRDQLWAEAVYRYQAGEPHWLTSKELKEMARKERGEFQETDPWDDELYQWLDTRMRAPQPRVTVGEALIHIGIDSSSQNKLMEMRVTSIFKKYGLVKFKTMRMNHWGLPDK